MDTKRLSILSLLAASLLGFGCKKAGVEGFKETFEKSGPAGTVSATSNPEVKATIDNVVTAIKANDNMTAVAGLSELRSRQDLSVDQAIAVQEMMSKVQSAIAQRAEAGDPQAKAQMEMIRMGKMRR